jgi:hypothetical protein
MFITTYYIGGEILVSAYHDSLSEARAWIATMRAIREPGFMDRLIIINGKHSSVDVGFTL